MYMHIVLDSNLFPSDVTSEDKFFGAWVFRNGFLFILCGNLFTVIL